MEKLALPEVTPLPYTSTRPAAFQVPQRKIGSPKTQESSSNDTSTDDSQQQQEDNDSSQSTPSKKIQKKAKQTTIDDEPTPIGRVQAVPSVSDDNRPKIKEDPTKLFVEDDDEKDAKRGTPAAARKQRDALLDAKERLKDRLKDEPMPKGKKTYTVTVNPDGSAKTEQDLLEQKQREDAEKERRAKKKQEKDQEEQRKAKLTGSAAKLKNKKKADDDEEEEHSGDEEDAS